MAHIPKSFPEKIRISTLKEEGNCPVSKWLSVPLLLSNAEMKQFLEEMGNFFMIRTDCVLEKEKTLLPRTEFLAIYEAYVAALKENRPINEIDVKMALQTAWTLSLDVAYAIEVARDKHIVKLAKPAVMAQVHRLSYSHDDQQFRSQVFGTNSFPLGIYLSYPQLFQDPKTHQLENILHDPKFSNTPLFQNIQKWIRYHTKPLALETKKLPIRVGKEVQEMAKQIVERQCLLH